MATLITTTGGPGDGAGSAAEDDRFPLSIGRPDLAHVAYQDLVVMVGNEQDDLPAGGGPARLDGTREVSGLVRVVDEDGRMAGMTIAPKDDDALLGTHDDGPLDLPVDYRTTAFGLLATQPGIASTEPTVTVLLAALVSDLPELDELADALEQAAADDPDYLEALPDEVQAALADLVAAFADHVDEVRAEVEEGLPGTTTTPQPTPTTVGLRAPSRAVEQEQDDPDGCNPSRIDNMIVVDTAREDHVCLTRAEFNGTAWEVEGTSTTPRWAVARAVNDGTPAEEIGVVPGKALSLPSLSALAADIAVATAQGAFGDLVNPAIDICNGLSGLFGRHCADPLPGLVERFVDKAESYFADAEVDLVLDGSESRTILSVNGLGQADAGGDASGEDVTTSIVATVTMTVIVPTIGMVIDVRGNALSAGSVSREFRVALTDMAATLAPDIAALVEGIRTGGIVDRLETLVDFTKRVLRATVDSGLLLAILREFYLGAGETVVADALSSLSQQLATSPLKWIDLGLDVLNAGVTLAMLGDDLGELSTSARYALGYDELPPLGPSITSDPPPPIAHDPLPNPALPDDSCGLRVAVVLDRSSSIRDAGDEAMAQVRGAAVGLVDALGTTPSSVRISAFGTWPSTRIGWTSLAGAEGRRAARQAASGVEFASGGDDGSTNWEAALSDVLAQDADLAVLVSDGNPTSYGSGIETTGPPGASFDFDPAALAAGVEAANVLKDDGTRVVAVGVGEVNVDPLRQLSGPEEGSDYFIGDFASLGTSLAAVATELCGAGLTVRHLVGGSPVGGAEYAFDVESDGDAESFTLVTAPDGAARLSLAEAGASVTARGPTALPLEGISCDQGGQPVDARVDEDDASVTLDLDGAVTCTFEWRALAGPEARLGEIVRSAGEGELRVVSFEPQPSPAGAVVGCLDVSAGRTAFAVGCDEVELAVSFTAGFAVLRVDDSVTDTDFQLTAAGGEVRFHVDVGGFSNGVLPAFSLGTTDLDLTVSAPAGASEPVVSGTVLGSDALEVHVRQPPLADRCLVQMRASGPFFPENQTITPGTGC